MSKKFNFSYGELSQRGDRLVVFMQRDATQLASVGYTPEYTIEFQSKVNYFKTLPPDAYWEGQQMMRTDEKNTSAKRLTNLLGEFRFRAKLALGAGSTAYRSFRFTKLGIMKDSELILFADHVIRTAQPLLDQLAIRCIDQLTLDEIEAEKKVLDDAIDAQQLAIATREEKTFEREDKANEIYEMLAEVCEVGKRIWDGVNPAYYDDYLIYGGPNTMEEIDRTLDKLDNEPT